METKRQQKFSKLIQKEIGEIFQREMKHLSSGTMITVTRVLMSPDLGLAKVYISFLTGNKEQLLDRVQAAKSELRKHLGNRIGKSVRIIPELALFGDDSATYAQHMDKVISSLDIPEDEEDEDDERDAR
ncbi:ribosome-binding factor A [Nitritalea halalkaliphila LW7]|uniref:Ribosome-binding factor A n=1 Tax=Nitritalea halalkaliphila LW7 TaxID=1189621 RepID=I5BYY3_9BACT|nr:30S ribosome-binding factor RbfA [Nitritalea halalkaliphila]EIM74785.1 ribosome-binding factor A [Nitritalea halalkaliphila LW7]